MGSQEDNDQGSKYDINSTDYWHAHDGLDIETHKYKQNKKHGLLICGMNWGGTPSDKPRTGVLGNDATFFSDSAKSYDYKKQIVKWFGFFGHRLETQAGKEGDFEKSILQTNWLNSQSPHVETKHFKKAARLAWNNFKRRINVLEPKLIFLFSVSMLELLDESVEASVCSTHRIGTHPRSCELFGPIRSKDYWGSKDKDLTNNEDVGRKLRVRVQKFDNTTIVALPHPTPNGPWPNDGYMKACKQVLNPIIKDFKKEREF